MDTITRRELTALIASRYEVFRTTASNLLDNALRDCDVENVKAPELAYSLVSPVLTITDQWATRRGMDIFED
jgi:hypothetical protein